MSKFDEHMDEQHDMKRKGTACIVEEKQCRCRALGWRQGIPTKIVEQRRITNVSSTGSMEAEEQGGEEKEKKKKKNKKKTRKMKWKGRNSVRFNWMDHHLRDDAPARLTRKTLKRLCKPRDRAKKNYEWKGSATGKYLTSRVVRIAESRPKSDVDWVIYRSKQIPGPAHYDVEAAHKKKSKQGWKILPPSSLRV